LKHGIYYTSLAPNKVLVYNQSSEEVTVIIMIMMCQQFLQYKEGDTKQQKHFGLLLAHIFQKKVLAEKKVLPEGRN